jgi:hypothetical protein
MTTAGQKLRQIQVGETFSYGGDTFTRLPDAMAPYWPSEPYVIQHHPNKHTQHPGNTFEQGVAWFTSRGLAVAS